jgi:hypothetical protein
MIPASDETRGHGTTIMAKFYKQQLEELLRTAPQRAMVGAGQRSDRTRSPLWRRKRGTGYYLGRNVRSGSKPAPSFSARMSPSAECGHRSTRTVNQPCLDTGRAAGRRARPAVDGRSPPKGPGLTPRVGRVDRPRAGDCVSRRPDEQPPLRRPGAMTEPPRQCAPLLWSRQRA